MKKIMIIVAILMIAFNGLTAQRKGHGNVQFAQIIKIDTSMTKQVTGQSNPDRWIYDASKISKETYELIKEAMFRADTFGEIYYFQYVPEYGEYGILHKEVYGGQFAGNGMLYINISQSLCGDEWFYNLQYRFLQGEDFNEWTMKDLYVFDNEGYNEKEAIETLYDFTREIGLWGAYGFTEDVFQRWSNKDTVSKE